ncbi:MAG: ABC transporter permease subunit [Clostridiaceae bacterium]|nr:ABC transporter permease subunit [Clostridiaceae bacterium]
MARQEIGTMSLRRRLYRDRWALVMLLPTFVLLFLFCYMPIYGILIAFQDYKIGNDILALDGSTKWVGLSQFKQFINSIFFTRVFGNTLRLSVENLIFGFWVPIVFALLLNEITHVWYKRLTQTFVYLPYFVSTVIVVAMMISITGAEGAVNRILAFFGQESINMMNSAKSFDGLYVFSNIWQTFGYSSIIYIAAISSIDPTLYEAATVDGANRLHKMIHITLPGIMPTVMILLILSVGGILAANTEKILLMYNSQTMDVADVIGTYVYKTGLQNAKYSYSAAIGLFANIINFVLVFGTNMISRRTTEYSLW